MNEVEDTVLLSASMELESTTSNLGSIVNKPNTPNTHCETPVNNYEEMPHAASINPRKKNEREENQNDEVIDEVSQILDGDGDKAKEKAKRKLDFEERGKKRVSTTTR